MTLRFTNVVKGQITQSLLTSIFERGGYRVTRFGIEELFSEIKNIDKEKYLALRLPLPLRFLPDLLVADQDMTRAWLVEVKFRRRFDESSCQDLYNELTTQREFWPSAYAVILIAEPMHPKGNYYQDYIRVLLPGMTQSLLDYRPNWTWEEGRYDWAMLESAGFSSDEARAHDTSRWVETPGKTPYDIWTNSLRHLSDVFPKVKDVRGDIDEITSVLRDLKKV